MTRSGSGSGYADGRGRDRRTAERSVLRRQSRVPAEVRSRAPRQQPSGPDEHYNDEEGESHHIAADGVTEPTEHANQEGDRSERQADKRMDIVLQYQQAGRETGERATQRRRDEIDAAGVDAHQ